jgi:hypothetical protein
MDNGPRPGASVVAEVVAVDIVLRQAGIVECAFATSALHWASDLSSALRVGCSNAPTMQALGPGFSCAVLPLVAVSGVPTAACTTALPWSPAPGVPLFRGTRVRNET